MVAVDQEALLGSLVPNVFIKKITLEVAGDILPERNPHIDHEREPNVVRNPAPPEGDGKLERQPRDPALLKKSQATEPLRVRVDLIIKERLDKGLIASWFGEQNFLKYLKIRLVQSKDAFFTNMFATRSAPLSMAAFSELFFSLGDVEHRLVPIDQVLSDSVLDQHTSFIDGNGDQVHDVAFTQVFSISSADIDHLSYFAVAFLDLEDLAKDFDLDLPPGAERSLDGRIASEVVIREKEIASETFVFRTETGEIWSGAVNQTSDGRWKTGDSDDVASKFVELTTVPNQKIQDFRDVKEVERLSIDLTVIENEILRRNNQTTILTNDRLDIVRKNSYTSDCCLSRDVEGNVRFSFALDMCKLARENTKFGALYRDDNQELLDEVKIRSIKLLRARVKGDGFSLKDERGLRIFNEEEEPVEMLIVAGESDPGEFVDRVTGKAALREIDILLEQDITGVRHFTGMDKTMKNVTFGKYQYGIEIEIEDRTASYLVNKLDDLLFARQVLNEYYAEGANATNYDVSSNQFKQEFIQRQESKHEGEEENSPWVLSTSAYLSTMDILIKDFDSERFEQCFLSFAHPRSGNPESVLAILKLMDNLSVKLGNLVGSTVTGKVNKFNPGQSQWRPQSTLNRSPGISLRTFKLEKFFPQIFDSDIPKSSGYDFLAIDSEPEGDSNQDGLLVISNSKYKERTNKEILKYFKTSDTNVNLKTEKIEYTVDDSIENSRYSYLSPSVIRMGTTVKPFVTLEKGTGLNDLSQYQMITANIARFNHSFRSPFVPFISGKIQQGNRLLAQQQTVKTDLSSVFADRNLLIVNPRITPATTVRVAAPSSQDVQSFVDAEDVMGTGSNFVKEDRIVEEQTSCGTSDSIEEKTKVNPNRFLFKISQPIIQNGPGSPLVSSKKKQQANAVQNTINFWDLRQGSNALDLKSVGFNWSKFSSAFKNSSFNRTRTNERLSRVRGQVRTKPAVSTRKQEYIKLLPNQIKSLFLGSIRQNLVLKNWFEGREEKDPIKDSDQRLIFDMNYKILSKIEVLVGYEKGTNTDANLQLRSPIWKLLTLERFNKSIDKNLICRIKEYQENDLDIKCPKSLRMPFYNKHFILSPENTISKPAPPPKPKKIQKSKARIAKLHKQQVRIRPEFAKSLITAKTLLPAKKIDARVFGGIPTNIARPAAITSTPPSTLLRNASFSSRVARFRLR